MKIQTNHDLTMNDPLNVRNFCLIRIFFMPQWGISAKNKVK